MNWVMSDSDTILQRALRRRDNFRRELDEIESFIRTFKRLADATAEEPTAVRIRHRSIEDKIKSSPQREVEQAVTQVLINAGRPVTTAQMLEAVTTHGVVIGGREPRWNLSAKLSRMEGIISIEGHGWWFENRPYKAVGYEPSQETEGLDEDQSSSPSDESGDLPLNS